MVGFSKSAELVIRWQHYLANGHIQAAQEAYLDLERYCAWKGFDIHKVIHYEIG